MKFKVILLITIILTGSYCTGLYAQSTQMIAEITEPVVTEFGTYHPNPVYINPSIPDYSVAPDFSNVTNFADFTFSNSELEILTTNPPTLDWPYIQNHVTYLGDGDRLSPWNMRH